MRYNAPQYAQALLSLVEEAPAHKERETIRGFLKTLATHGALSLLPEIVRAVEKFERERKGVREVSVRTPERESELGIRRKLHFKSELTLIKDVRLRGGAIVESEDVRVDNSIALRLRRLQEALVK